MVAATTTPRKEFAQAIGVGWVQTSASAPPILFGLALHRWRFRIFVSYDGPSVGPKAKGNASPDRERDHSRVPQSHGATDGLAFFSQRCAIWCQTLAIFRYSVRFLGVGAV
jgi:hypothetical protein